ncbi:MAG: hypothetical protein IJR08_05970 [Bacilli bacterium]|nr:hypothetical protein [Bacilli bacterium]
MKKYLEEQFLKTFQSEPDKYLSCGGRFEVLGNHTDHNHGLCIAATCSLSIYAAIKKRDDEHVRLLSEGFGYFEIDLTDLEKVETEVGQPAAIIRGIADYLSDNKYKVGGFDIYLKSEVPAGAGVSSSAAFELLLAQTYNVLFNSLEIPLMTLCKAGQFAEREYYGKMCGLLDQIGVAYGGLIYIDFKDIANPEVKPLRLNLDGYQFVIVNSGGSHAELSHLYKAIPDQMFEVANVFGKSFLRYVDYEELKKNKQDVIEKCGKEAYQKAKHFFEENKRVEKAYKAIEKNDVEKLIKLINESRESSTDLLENMCVEGKVKGSPLEACRLIMKASHQKAGVKINGGGFAGSVIALVPKDELRNVVDAAKEKYGKENIHLVDVRNDTPCELI